MNRRSSLRMAGTALFAGIAGCSSLYETVGRNYPSRIRVRNRDSSAKTIEITIRQGGTAVLDEEVTIEADSTHEMATNLDPNGRYTRIGASYEGPDGFIIDEFLELRGQEEYSSARPVIIIDEEGEISIFSHPSEVTTQGD